MMTRETRVGLLAGLTVIVVFAMILSHKGSQPGAQLPPGTFQPPRDVLAQQTDIRPAVAVAEPDALPPNPTDRLTTVPHSATPASLPQSGGLPRELQDPARFEIVAPPPQDSTGRSAQDDFLDNLRRRLDGSEPPPPRQGQVAGSREAATSGAGAADGGRTYVAQSNDTLTSIARKTLGSDSMDAVRAIFELNKDQLKDMDSIHAGQKLRIPPKPGSPTVAPAPAADRRSTESGSAGEKPPAKPAAKTRQRQHTVKPGESYSRIAEQYLGDPKRWREIYDANKAKYPNADALPQGATIVIPESEKKLAQR